MAITKILYHPLFILSITLFAIFFFISLDKSGKKSQSSSQNILILENEVKQASEKLLDTEDKIAQTDSQLFLEKIVRNELLVQKPEEYILQIPDTHNLESTTCLRQPCEDAQSEQEKPIKAWIKLLF